MVNKIRASVAMAVFNGEKYLKEQLDSILNQLTAQDELVISDDGSTDDTMSLLKEYAGTDFRIKLINGNGCGIKKNFENAITHCRGSYIFLSDQDDIWLPGKLEKVIKALKEHSCGTVIHDASVFYQDSQKQAIDSFFSFRNAKAGIWKNFMKNSYMGCCMAFRHELKNKILPIPENIEMHDQWIGMLSDYYMKKSYFLREPLLLYRRHDNNGSLMEPYSVGKRIKNRYILLKAFLGRIWHIS